jgi:hypothetical protein
MGERHPPLASASRLICNGANRVYNNLWLIDLYQMTGPFGNDLTPAFRQLDLVSLQLSPGRISAACPGHYNHRNRELSPRGPDFRGTVAYMDDFIRRRLVSGGTESCCADEFLN